MGKFIKNDFDNKNNLKFNHSEIKKEIKIVNDTEENEEEDDDDLNNYDIVE